MDNYNTLEVLAQIDPARCTYSEWIAVGMALKAEGLSAGDWDRWSSLDPARYNPGECAKKWRSFAGSGIAAGTLVQLARAQGAMPERDEGHALDWDDVIDFGDSGIIIDQNYLEGRELPRPPQEWRPTEQIIKYLSTLFEASETVGYVTEAWRDNNRYLPTKGVYTRTAGELIRELSECGGDVGKVIGDYKPEAGAWVRFNPLDGKGVKNENVTEYRYALVESDTADLEKQYEIITALQLPVAMLVHSGARSLHAIVHIDAESYSEYRKRVDYLYDVCAKNGLDIDAQNRNPSRLSRLPGVMRNGQIQYIVAANIGHPSYNAWREWLDSVNDELPDKDNLRDVWDGMPDLSPELISGVLRQGHKMLLAGPSKAGKSYALIELCIAIAEGDKWFSWQCAQGRILYVNLELDRASCLHRFRDVYAALGVAPRNLRNVDVWNLRGKAVPMDKLAPKLIRRALKERYIAIIIDPIYKVITGDENSADQMAAFCNQFDLVCDQLQCAVIYCHHHSKGAQGQKRSMDRASGSGVFARDPDAALDMIELDLTDEIRSTSTERALIDVCRGYLDRYQGGAENVLSQDDLHSAEQTLATTDRLLSPNPPAYAALNADLAIARDAVKRRTGWRIEGTLREFARFEPVNLFFDYPRHTVDAAGTLKDIDPDTAMYPQRKPMSAHQIKAREKLREAARIAKEQARAEEREQARAVREIEAERKARLKRDEFAAAVAAANHGKPPTCSQLAAAMQTSNGTISKRAKQYGYVFDDERGGYVEIATNL